jgi:hypothetical protein
MEKLRKNKKTVFRISSSPEYEELDLLNTVLSAYSPRGEKNDECWR